MNGMVRAIVPGMKTTMEMVVQGRYGVGVLECDAIVIEWAAEHMAQSVGCDLAVKEWRRINRKRERMGQYTTIPKWGSLLWDAFSAQVR
jgi:hypothetical protein